MVILHVFRKNNIKHIFALFGFERQKIRGTGFRRFPCLLLCLFEKRSLTDDVKSDSGIVLGGYLGTAGGDGCIEICILEFDTFKHRKSYLDVVGCGDLAVSVDIALDNSDSVNESRAVVIEYHDAVASCNETGGLDLAVLAVNLYVIAAEIVNTALFGKSEQIVLTVDRLHCNVVT